MTMAMPPIGEDDLQALVDCVLDPVRAEAVRRYLEAHPEAAGRVRAYAEQREALRAALAFKQAEPVPPRLRIANIRAERRRVTRLHRQVAAALVATLATGAGLGWAVRGAVPTQTVPPPAIASEPAALHRLLAEPSSPIEARRSGAGLGPWLADHLGEALPLPDLAEFGFALDLAWVLPAGEGPSALLRYVDPDGVALSVRHRPTRDPVPQALRCTDEPGGVVTYGWSDGRWQHAVTAALPRERLRPIALAVERALRAPPPGRALIANHTRRPCPGAAG